MSNVITRQKQIEAMGIQVLPEVAQDLILAQPANVQARVKSRQDHVRSCLEAVQEAVQAQLGKKDKAYSITVLVAELLGTGGHNDLGNMWGGETTRLSHFETCGTGRRHANDGAAWDRTILDVLNEEIEAYSDETGSSNGKLTLQWDDQFKEVELRVNYKTTGETCLVEHLYSHEDSWESDVVPPLLKLNLARSMRAMCGQLLVALTRDQGHLALTHNDVADGEAWNGIVIDHKSFKEPGALEAVGLGFEYWTNKL